MPRGPLAVLVSSLLLAAPLAGCGGDKPTDPTPIPCSYTLSPAARTVDVFPLLCRLLGLTPPKHLDGDLSRVKPLLH